MSGEENNIGQNGLVQSEGMDTQEHNAQSGGDMTENDDERKLFVGGLGWDTTQDELKEYMEQFGPVSSCAIKTDMETRKSRGFGFVVFQDASTIDKVLEQAEHKIKDRKIDPKRANPRGDREVKKKIFVGKVDPSTTEETLRGYFEQFGTVEKVELPYDKMKDQRRNFVFIEFDSPDTVAKVLSQENHTIGEMEVDIKKVTPPAREGGRGRGRGFGFRGGERGRGGRGGNWNYGGGGGGWGNQGYGQGYNQGYGGYNQGYGGYNQGYGYGPGYGYDQSGYGYGGGWGGYDQSGYGYGYGGYGNGGYAGYDYSGWGGYDQSGQQAGYGKAPKGGRGGGYRPY